MEDPNMSPFSVSGQSEPKNNNKNLIIIIIAVVMLCCCCFAGIGSWWLWNNGDELLGISLLVNLL